jgi:hypothetical protein
VHAAWGSLFQLLLNVVLLMAVGAAGLTAQRVIWGRLASRAPAAPAALAAGTPSQDGDGIDRGAGSSR